MQNVNPYQDLEPVSFWWAAVAAWRPGERFAGIWRSRFEIGKDSRFLTAGSCFARHIGKWLSAHGFNWIDSEPAAPTLPAEEGQTDGYGVFSFRTGNIYTAALLRQWMAQALCGERALAGDAIEEHGRYFDPLRPTIPRAGYGSAADMYAARTHTLNCIRQAVADADVFVFTLGLTEAWLDARGFAYPLCPGTVKGTFDAKLHKFVNFDFERIAEDLDWTFTTIKKLNSRIKFLLTVSPVPLVATATGTHVLPATIYSKSTLRSVAGFLASTRDDVDYFPSYELISSFPVGSVYYEDNLRSVKKAGVDFVMAHFEAGLSAGGRANEPVARRRPESDEDVICEELALDPSAAADTRAQAEGPSGLRVCLIGDSHMIYLSESLNKLGIKHSGGKIMNGVGWASNLLHLDAQEIFVPLENKQARERWAEAMKFFDENDVIDKGSKFIISNIGIQTHHGVSALLGWMKRNDVKYLSRDVFMEFYLGESEKKIQIAKRLVNMGYRLIMVTDPPLQHMHPGLENVLGLFEQYERLVSRIYADLGCRVFNARDFIKRVGFKDEYCSRRVLENGVVDWCHASPAYYEFIAKVIVDDHLQDPGAAQ